MNIFDTHFFALQRKQQIFIVVLSLLFFIVAAIGFFTGLFNLVESFLFIVIGSLYTQMIRLQYRVEFLESKKKSK